MTTEQVGAPSAVEQLAFQVLNAAVGAVELTNVYLGHTLGLYRALADHGPLTSSELAGRTSCDERYMREWLQGQAVSGFVTTDGEDLRTARFSLAEGGREVLVDELSEAFVAPISVAMAATGKVLPDLVEAYRTGKGVSYSDYGPEAVRAQEALNRPAFVNELAQNWVGAIPGLAERLSKPAIVADLGCGAGWSTIALAKAYPHLAITGYDADTASLDLARGNAVAEGVAVNFAQQDLSQPFGDTRRFDVAMMFECLHDMGYPEKVLRNTRAALADGGELIIMDEATDEHLVAPTADPIQRMFANISGVWCLPQGRDEPDADPVGTVMRPDRLRELATAAGFGSVEVLPIEHPFFRFYRLTA